MGDERGVGEAVEILLDTGKELGQDVGNVLDVGDRYEKLIVGLANKGGDVPLRSIEPFRRSRPVSLKRTATFTDIKSFIAYVVPFAEAHRCAGHESRIYSDRVNRTFTCILDDHAAYCDGKDAGGNEVNWNIRMSFCDHVAIFRCTFSPEWIAWTEKNRKPFSQVDFAEFIEDHADDIREPSPADLLTIATNLHAHKDAEFTSGVRLDNGEVKFAYVETVRGSTSSGDVKIPEEFQLRLRPFFGSSTASVMGRFRYRLSKDSGLAFHYSLLRLTEILDEELCNFAELIESKTSLPVLFGSVQ